MGMLQTGFDVWGMAQLVQVIEQFKKTRFNEKGSNQGGDARLPRRRGEKTDISQNFPTSIYGTMFYIVGITSGITKEKYKGGIR